MSGDTAQLAERIRQSSATGTAAVGQLKTSDRIIARVTDGIYREPWSAFRELISNAYDADATSVSIDTDFPFFNQIRISDNGNGMDSTTIADLLTNIGGSSKRTARGKMIGTVNPLDPTLSRAGRKLIGKIGIGLFAVAQLTQHFQIISKRKGSNERVSATVKLNTYRDDSLAEQDDGVYESGTFKVVSEKVLDVETHGTTIVLMNIKPSVKEKLQSKELWEALDEQAADGSIGLIDTVSRPTFYIGRVGEDGKISEPSRLPWNGSDSPRTRFHKLFDETIKIGSNSNDRADLSHLDNYLKMIWRLSLGSPLKYIERHPFDVGPQTSIALYALSNKRRGAALPVQLGDSETLRSELGLSSGDNDPLGRFDVFVDGVELSRPVKLPEHLQGSSAIGNPILFVGKVDTDFGGVTEERSGGKLSFEAYLYWNSKIIPKESIGALIRVNGASGTLFDPEFLGYQISEQTRKKQITCEIFVLEGLDGALNIDRESYNTSHPHYLFIQKWLHSSFRQFATQHKRLGTEARAAQQARRQGEIKSRISAHADEVWSRMRGESYSVPTIDTAIVQTKIPVPSSISGSSLDWSSPRMMPHLLQQSERIQAIALVLEAYGLLDGLEDQRRADLVYDIISIFEDAI